MNIVDELERLTRLRDEGSLTEEEFAKAKTQLLAQSASGGFPIKGIRRQSSRKFCGLPLWSVAIGPDWECGEMRGHARGIVAVGDVATGWVALGGVARGIVAIGGLAIGLFSFGGAAIGVAVAVGGAAVGAIAFGGGAVGLVAVGGGAYGYYALGGGAAGTHAVSALHQDPVAVDFFRQYFPWLPRR